jgi:flagellin-like hook-associated protein FlgL
MHSSTNPEEIKTEIEKLRHTVTNIWNIKQFRTELSLSMFFVELKPAPNNNNIFNVEYIQR